MRRLTIDREPGEGLTALVIGAHPDDIEIGAGGTILRLASEGQLAAVRWVVLSADRARADEAHRSAETFLAAVPERTVTVLGLKDGYFPYIGSEVKDAFEELKSSADPDLILTHRQTDAHQDHRLVAELTWNTFRDHLILEYEIPKYDGDLGPANVFLDLPEDVVARKIELLLNGFPSQRDRHWFTEETFRAMLRLRGVECRAVSGYAEGFSARKLVL
jgi:LmbE family N-acetylglucosaminyl deacetylase